jgi:hypothetical protein
VPAKLKEFFFKYPEVPPDLSSYDAIGFSLDNVLVHYNEETLKLKVKTALEYLKRELEYPQEIIEFDYDRDINLARAGVIWDIDGGVVLRLSEERQIMKAMSGFTQYSED